MSWTDYQGHAAGAWQLDSFLGLRDLTACYEGANDTGAAALVQIVPAGSSEAGQIGRSWETARTLAGAHLLRVLDTGPAVIAGEHFVYAALELPDDDVTEMLVRRSLAEDEVRAIIVAAAAGLEFLHSRGLCHGAVRPSNILFAGATPKLSVDTLGPAGEAGRDTDLHQLGTTITEMMAGESTGQAADRLTAPWREVAVGCLGGSGSGWTAARVVQAASAPSQPAAVDRVQQADAPSPEHASPISLMNLIGRRWLVAALIAVVSLFAAAIFFAHRDTETPSVVVTPTPQPGAPAAAKEKPSPTEPPRNTVPVQPAVRGDRSNSWAVIAATYLNFDAAQKRANRLVQNSPGLKAHVYPAQGGGNRYYVVLGSGLSSDAASALRQRAVTMGAPSDTYVTQLQDR